jgi:deoxycytidylate deaminase
MTLIPKIASLVPYFAIAASEASKSPCLRRKFGAVIVTPGTSIAYTAAHNERVGKCCGGNICARTRLQVQNGERTEVGGEIHAETAALIKHGLVKDKDTIIIVAGVDAYNNPIYGRITYPCHACAMAIKFVGIRYVYLLDSEDSILSVSINQILLEREAEWDLIE